MSRLFEDPAYEQRLLDDLDRRYKRMDNYRKQARETDVGNLLNDHARRYPYVTPGVLEAMARAGVPADSQSAEQLASMSGQMNAQRGELAPGGKVNASWFRRNVADPVSAFGRTAVRTATTGLHGAMHELVSRPVMAAFESGKPVQSFLGMAPDEYMESYRSQGASPMVRAFNAWRAGNGPQGLEDENFLGAGFVPGGRIYEEHREQLGTRTVDGQAALDRYGGDISPGRTVAAEFIEPGTTGFDTVSGLLDLAAGIFLDPAAKIAKPIGAVNKARKTFGGTADMLPRTRAVLEGAQIVGPRKTTIAKDVEDFLVRDNAGRRLVDDLVERTSAGDVWRMMGRKINPQTASEIARASNPDAVRAALRTTLGTSIREKPTATRLSRGIGRVAAPVVGPEGSVYGVGAATRHRFADGIRPRPSSKARLALSARMFNDVPGEQINVDDIGRAMHAVDEFAKNARLTPEVTTKHLDALAEIDADDPARVSKVWNVARDLMKDTDAALEDVWGRNPHLQDRLTKIVDDFETTFRQYAIDQVGSPMYFPGAKTSVAANGDTIVLPTVQVLSEFMDMHVPLPSARAIRRDTSGVFKALERVPHLRDAAEISGMVADHYLMRAWKPAQLLRGAWAVRVIADEQARMAATGLNSAFNNPLSYIAWITGKRGNIDMTGSLIRQGQDFTDAMSRSSHWLGNDLPGTVRTGDYKQARKGDRDYARGWGDELNQLATEEGAQRIAGGLREGDRGYNPLTATSDQAIKDWFWNSDHLRQLDEGPARGLLSASRANADAYVDSVRARIHIKTGGAAELRNAAGETVDVASATADELAEARWVVTRDGDADLIAGLGQGKILDIPVHMTEPYDGMAKEIGKALQTKMSVGPEVVKVSRDLELKGRRGQRIALGDMYDKAIDFLYHNMMGKHTDALSRSPVFKQMYWDEAERLLSSMSQEVQDQVFKNARKAKLDRDTLSRMGRIVGDPNRVGDAVTDVLLADNIAKAHALNGTKKMLYDLSKRSQFSDVTRLLFPFGEAFKEVITTWSRIGKENPASIERFRQVAMSGFFTEGPYGEEVFCVDPETEALTKRGWLRYHQLREDDELLSLDPDSDEVCWQQVEAVNAFPYEGEMVRWSGRINALTTPNHRWLVEDWRLNKPKNSTPPKRDFKTTEWLSTQKQRPIIVGGGTPAEFTDTAAWTDEFVELVGWVITEGCYNRRYVGVTVTQSEDVNPDKTQRIRNLVKYFAADPANTATEWKRRRGAQCTFYFGKGIGRKLREVCPDKQLTPQFLTSLTLDQANLLLETLLDGDGHRRPDGYRQFIQDNAGRVSAFQMLAGMLGICTQALRYDGVSRSLVTLHKVRHLYTHNAESRPYNGIVWCPRVKTGVWFARRNGSTYFTGNSYPGGDMPGLFGGMAGGGAGMMLGGMAGPLGALAGAGIGAAVGGAVGNAADPGGPGQIDMVGNASGLNLVTQSFLPGFGPIVQIPASIFLKEKPGVWSDLEDLILPYGRSGASETGFLESMAPAWMKRALTAMQADPEQDRIFGNTVGHMHSMLYASGEYSDESGMVTPEQGRRLTEDATRHARWLFALRAVAQFVVPTGPQPQYSADTPEGLITFNALTEEYRNMAEDTEAGGWETALDRFIERFGAQNTMALQAKTKERRKRSMGETGVAWERANPDLVEEFPNTVGWFAPEVEDDPFDYTAYKGAIARGDIETLTPEQQRMLHNHMLGRAAMAKVDAELGDRTDPGARAYRRDMRQWLKAEYPGFDSTIAAPIRADRDEMIAEFNRAVEHPKLKDTDIAKGWREYMQAREEAQSRLPEGLVTFKGQKAAHLARYLRDYGQYLAHEYPGFGEVFDRILESELRDEDEEAA